MNCVSSPPWMNKRDFDKTFDAEQVKILQKIVKVAFVKKEEEVQQLNVHIFKPKSLAYLTSFKSKHRMSTTRKTFCVNLITGI